MNRKIGQVVVLLAHPNLQESYANKELIDAVKEMYGVVVRNLYDTEEDMFDVDEWSRLLTDSSGIVIQFPFHWMAAPYMMKRWADDVLTHLARTPIIVGKSIMAVVTVGAEEEDYRSGGRNRFTVDELLRPYQTSAILSGMVWETPLVVYGLSNEDRTKNIAQGATKYKEAVEMLLKEKNLINVISW